MSAAKKKTAKREWYVIEGDSVLWGPTTAGGAAQFVRARGSGLVVATMPGAIPPPPEEQGFPPPPWVVEARQRARTR
jgi:hypothetical protein